MTRSRIVKTVLIAIYCLAVIAVGIKLNSDNYVLSPDISKWESRYLTNEAGLWFINEDIYNSQYLSETIEVIYGPFMNLTKGDYCVLADYEVDNLQSIKLYAFEKENCISTGDELLLYPDARSVAYRFKVFDDLENFEVRVCYDGTGSLKIKNITIHTYEWLALYQIFIILVVAGFCTMMFFVFSRFFARDLLNVQRKRWLDLARGIGILFAFWGHTWWFDGTWFLYGFHMPLFFIISGYLYKDSNLKTCLANIARRLLWPYLLLAFFNSLLRIPYYLVGNWTAGSVIHRLKLNWLGTLRGDWHDMPNCTPLWFLTASAVATVIFCLIRKIGNEYIRYLILLMIAFAGIYNITASNRLELPWGLHTVPLAVAFIGIGFFVKEHDWIEKQQGKSQLINTAVCGIIGVIAIVINHIYFGDFDLFLNHCGNPYIMLLGATSFSVFIIRICYVICTINADLFRPFEFLGRHSLFFFAFDHWSKTAVESIAGIRLLESWVVSLVMRLTLAFALYCVYRLIVMPLGKFKIYKFLDY